MASRKPFVSVDGGAGALATCGVTAGTGRRPSPARGPPPRTHGQAPPPPLPTVTSPRCPHPRRGSADDRDQRRSVHTGTPHAHRRQARRGRVGGKRSTTSTRPPRRCSARSPTPSPADMERGHRRGPPGVRRDRLVDRPRVPQALPRAAAGGPRGRAARSCAPSSSPRSAARSHAHLRAAARRAAARTACAGRPSMIDEFQWERDLPDGERVRHAAAGARWSKEPIGVVGAIIAVELPVRVIAQQARPGARHRQHGRRSSRRPTRRGTPPASAGSSPSRPTSRPAWSTSSRRRTTSVGEELIARPARRPDLVHRLDRDRQAHHGEGRRHAEARCSSSSAASRPTSSSTTPTSRPTLPMAPHASCIHAGQGCAMTTRMLAAPVRATTRASRSLKAGVRERPLRRPDRPGEPAGPADQRQAARAGARLHREGQGRGRPARRRRRPRRRTSTRATSSSRRCSPTSTTR